MRRLPHRPRKRVLWLLGAVLAVSNAAAALAASPAEFVARLNQERRANGIPGRVQLEPSWSRGCRHHVRYEALNGLQFTHYERAGRPGFTRDGHRAGLRGDQSYNGTSFARGNPFENLPYHMVNLLSPALTHVGAFEQDGRACVQIGGWRRFPRNTIFSAPGQGRRDVPTSQVVEGEWPFAPGDLVGLPQGTTTGPHIYLYAAGPWVDGGQGTVSVLSATITEAGGRPVDIRIVDGGRFPQTFLGAYHAAILIPVHPLASGVYTAQVTMRAGKVRLTRRWRFATSSEPIGGEALVWNDG